MKHINLINKEQSNVNVGAVFSINDQNLYVKFFTLHGCYVVIASNNNKCVFSRNHFTAHTAVK